MKLPFNIRIQSLEFKILCSIIHNSFFFIYSNKRGFIKLTKRMLVTYLIIATTILGTSLLYLFNPFSVKKTEAAWWNDSWSYRKAITFTHNANVTNTFIQLDTVDTLGAPDTFQADCGDVRFTDASGVLLKYYYDSASGACDTNSTDFNVLIPSIVSGSNLIYMYYGNPAAPNGTEAVNFSQTETTPSGGAAASGSEEKAPSPAGYWKFDDGTGTTTQDSSTNNAAGTITEATWQTEDQCVSGKCLKFDGSNDTVTIPTNSNLVMSSSFTISAWIRLINYTSPEAPIVLKHNTGFNFNYYFDVSSDGTLFIGFYNGTGYVDSVAGTGRVLEKNRWYFVTAVFDDSANTLTTFIDGKQNTQATGITSTPYTTNPGDLRIGGVNTQYLNTFIDDVKIYPFARSASQIQADFNSRGSNEGTGVSLGGSDVNKNLSNGLVGYWEMDESSGNRSDSSGNTQTLTDNNTVTTSAGKFGYAGQFTASNSEYLSINDNSTLSTGNVDFTVAAWVKADSLGASYRNIVSKMTGGSNFEYRLHYRGPDGGSPFSFQVSVDGSSDNPRVDATNFGTPTTGNWYFVVGWHDSISDTINIQVNNGAVNSTSHTSGVFDSNAAFWVGAGQVSGSPGEYWDGQIDEVRFYKRVLSPTERTQLYNFAPGPVSYWNLEESTGTTAYDRVNSLNGTLTNGPTWAKGKFGSGLDFSSTDSRVIVSDNALLRPGTITVSAWVKPSSTSPTYQRIINKGWTGSGAWALYLNTSHLHFSLMNSGLIEYIGIASSAITANQWNHVVGTFDGTTVRVYVNGILGSTSATVSGSNFLQHTSDIEINDTNSQDHLTGQIDEIKIYNYARSQKQIVEDMNAGHMAVGSPVGSALAHYRFDEGYGQTINNSGSQGSTINGTLGANSGSSTDDPTWTQSGKFGKALSYDGSGDYINIGDNSIWDFGSNDYAVSVWFKRNSTSTRDVIFSKDSSSASSRQFLMIIHDDGSLFATAQQENRIRFSYFTSDANEVLCDTTTRITDSNWHHVVGQRNGSNINIYLDGKLETCVTTSGTPGSMQSTATSVEIGRRIYTGSEDYFHGSIDELKVYNFALNTEDIQKEYNGGFTQVMGAKSTESNGTTPSQGADREYCIPGDTGTCNAPIAEWMFDEKSGTTLNDKSGNGETGTLTDGNGGNGDGNTPPRWGKGKYGGGLTFDGTDDYVTIGSNALGAMSGAFSIEAWVKLTANDGVIIGEYQGGSCGDGLFQISSGNVQFHDGNFSFNTGNRTVNNGNWHHVAYVYNGSTGMTYVDGIPGSSTTGTTWRNTCNVDVRIGQGVAGTTGMNGSIDHIRIFNYARSAAQINWSFSKGDPIAHWRFDECQGTTFKDSSGNNNTPSWNGSGSGSQTATGNCSTSATTAWYQGRNGKYNSSLFYDGTDDYLSVTLSPALSTTEKTGCAWFKANGAPGETKSIIGGEGYRFHMWLNPNGSIQYGSWTTSTNEEFDSVATFSTSNWVFACQVLKSASYAKLYVNGKFVEQNSLVGNINSFAVVEIGRHPGANGNYFNGQIDDVMFFNYELNPTQIKSLYNSGSVTFGPNTGSP